MCAVFAMAPVLGPAFTLESLEKIDVPLAIVAGAADAIVPVLSSARSYARAHPAYLADGVGHYVFLADCTEARRSTLPALCIEAPRDREAIHAKPADLAVGFFARHLR